MHIEKYMGNLKKKVKMFYLSTMRYFSLLSSIVVWSLMRYDWHAQEDKYFVKQYLDFLFGSVFVADVCEEKYMKNKFHFLE